MTLPLKLDGRPDAMVPLPFRVVARNPESSDVVTLEIEAIDGLARTPEPGQFAMLWAFGVGEVPISYSRLPGDGRLHHTVRRVGAATEALCAAEPGTVLGARGPFGRGWQASDAAGANVVILAGGLGLAPLRPVVDAMLRERDRYGRVAILVGARSPSDLLFSSDLARWSDRADLDVHVAVDLAAGGWTGDVGAVTALVPRVQLGAGETFAFVCGPELMMRFSTRCLMDRGIDPTRIRVSLERNMQCAIGHCGRCQLGPEMVCRDGPVFPWSRVADQLGVRER